LLKDFYFIFESIVLTPDLNLFKRRGSECEEFCSIIKWDVKNAEIVFSLTHLTSRKSTTTITAATTTTSTTSNNQGFNCLGCDFRVEWILKGEKNC
jgi:hypothetical protein